jgi:glycine hydroxymethyltransferase
MTPGGVRIGTPAVTTRGLLEKDMEQIAEFLHRISQICVETQAKAGKNLKQFLQALEQSEKIKSLSNDVEGFSKQFDIPGVDFNSMKYFKQ